MIVSSRPSPNIPALFSQSKSFEYLDIEFYPLGREALLSAMIHLGLEKGDGIIVPAYMCSSTIGPLEAYGFDIVFIDIDQHLRLPTDQAKSLVSDNRVKALLVVHYFGFTQALDEIVTLCHQHDVKVIVDASHSFLSQFSIQASERQADVEIFSMRKSLPVQDGGALRLNTQDTIGDTDKSCVSWVGDVRNIVIRLAEKVLTMLGLNIYAGTITKLKNNARRASTSSETNTEVSPCSPSWNLKQYLGSESYLQKTRQRIVQNFTYLSGALTSIGFKLAFEDMGNNVPQACVIYDEKGGLAEHLRAQGIGAWRWPAEEIPSAVANQVDKYPNANYYDKTLVLLPIHQSVSNRQMNYMIQVLSKWQQR